MIKEEQVCRVCGGDLKVLVDFGEIYPSGFVTSQEGLTKAPLVLAFCEKCALVQLKHTVNLDLMYRKYWYSSSLNKSMVDSLEDVVRSIKNYLDIEEKENEEFVVLDIGCNDGTLFKFFSPNVTKVGFDPALNLSEKAEENCDYFINDYFSASLYPRELPKARVVTSIAMFYDLPDPNSFIQNVKEILADDGVWVIQLTDLLSMLRANAFDNVCHEHLEYYSLLNLIKLMKNNGLRVVDADYNMVNGGSLRVFVTWDTNPEQPISPLVSNALGNEYHYMSQWQNPIEAMMLRVGVMEDVLKTNLELMRKEGKTAFLLGASTKGNTLLQVWKFTNEDFPYALEVNSDKLGLRTVGSDIPIISEQEGLAMNPGALVVLPWHFIGTMKNNFTKYMDDGGLLVAPLPNFNIIKRVRGREWIFQERVWVS